MANGIGPDPLVTPWELLSEKVLSDLLVLCAS